MGSVGVSFAASIDATVGASISASICASISSSISALISSSIGDPITASVVSSIIVAACAQLKSKNRFSQDFWVTNRIFKFYIQNPSKPHKIMKNRSKILNPNMKFIYILEKISRNFSLGTIRCKAICHFLQIKHQLDGQNFAGSTKEKIRKARISSMMENLRF